ncbi:efflux RND transporter periplasmic adaptor subunit [Rummeliibacillus sp. JY-2-4R]
MKKWGKSKSIIAAVAVVFIGSNLFLLLKDDSKAARTVNISEWTKIEQGHVKKLLHTTGVTKPESETHVYFDSQKGSLDTILVKEGDVVTTGTPLFSYDSHKLDQQKADLEDEGSRLQGEIDSADQEISSLQQITPDQSSDETSSASDDNKVKVDVNMNVSSIVDGNVQERIAEVEGEKGKLEAALSANESKISRVEEQLADLSVSSTVDGQIVNINADLKDPMITIASTMSVVKAVATAKQIEEITQGQKVKLYSTLTDKTYNGIVSQVITYPNEVEKDNAAKKNKEKTTPTYSFLVKLQGEVKPKIKKANASQTANTQSSSNEQTMQNQTTDDAQSQQADQVEGAETTKANVEKPLLVGTDMKLQVTVAEAAGTPIISSKSVLNNNKKHYVYQLNDKGLVQKQPIELGVTYKGKNQIVNGLKINDMVVSDKDAITLASPANFITPLKTSTIQNKEIKNMPKKQHAKYILMGLFE